MSCLDDLAGLDETFDHPTAGMGASTGMSADDGAFARSAGFLIPRIFSYALFRGIQVRPGLGPVRLGLLQIALGNRRGVGTGPCARA